MTATADQLKRASRHLRETTARRDELIRQMRAEGATLRQIAPLAELTAMGVKKILDRSSGDEDAR
jgi:hypothetical protein